MSRGCCVFGWPLGLWKVMGILMFMECPLGPSGCLFVFSLFDFKMLLLSQSVFGDFAMAKCSSPACFEVSLLNSDCPKSCFWTSPHFDFWKLQVGIAFNCCSLYFAFWSAWSGGSSFALHCLKAMEVCVCWRGWGQRPAPNQVVFIRFASERNCLRPWGRLLTQVCVVFFCISFLLL